MNYVGIGLQIILELIVLLIPMEQVVFTDTVGTNNFTDFV